MSAARVVEPVVSDAAPTPAVAAPTLAKVLFVDDDVALLEAVRRQLRRRFDVSLASSGMEAFQMVEERGPFSVVVSDMQMPGLDGTAVLRTMRELSNDTVRILMTGYADVDAAIAAVNDGKIFRFLCKPCPPETLIDALEGAVAQYRLVTAERELLEQTLRGSISALLETLALANPTAFARALRVREVVTELSDRLEVADRWQVEVACMLAQIGAVALPTHVAERLHCGLPLAVEDQDMVDRMPDLAEQLLAPVPRLEDVRAIILGSRRTNRSLETMPLGARIIRIAVDFDTLQARGKDVADIVATLRRHPDYYDLAVLDALEALRLGDRRRGETTETAVENLRIGMVIASDLRRSDGTLLVGRGQKVTPSLLERIRNISARSDLEGVVEVLVQEADRA